MASIKEIPKKKKIKMIDDVRFSRIMFYLVKF